MLIWYNNLDVEPMLEGLQKMKDFWAARNIDAFKSGSISLPGLAFQRMFKDLPDNAFFKIWSNKEKHWHEQVKSKIVGGPSIVFHRHHSVGVTTIRDGKKLVENIVGYDANALYLWSLMQQMPTGLGCSFEPENLLDCDQTVTSHVYENQPHEINGSEALGEATTETNADIEETVKNTSQCDKDDATWNGADSYAGYDSFDESKEVKRQPVSKERWKLQVEQNMRDVFHRKWMAGREELVWLEYQRERLEKEHGKSKIMCFSLMKCSNLGHKITIMDQFHGNAKLVNKPTVDDKGNAKSIRYLCDGFVPELNLILEYNGCRWHGCECVKYEMSENERKTKARHTVEKLEYLNSLGYNVIVGRQCEFKKEYKNDIKRIEARLFGNLVTTPNIITGKEIVKRVQHDKFFGLVECDIEVPRWSKELREKFAEFTPIFKNTTISREDVGPHMKQYAAKKMIMQQSRRCLIGSYYGKRQLLATPLLQWYLKHGLQVTKVYGAVQFNPSTPFKHLGEEVADLRRKADVGDDEAKVQGEMAKLCGNR